MIHKRGQRSLYMLYLNGERENEWKPEVQRQKNEKEKI